VEDRARSHMGTEIGRRLLSAGRPTEALATLEKARPKQRVHRREDHDDLYLTMYGPETTWEEVYIEALDATGQKEQAQTLRWKAFEERLSSKPLRIYLGGCEFRVRP
jgi:hypothetical protein